MGDDQPLAPTARTDVPVAAAACIIDRDDFSLHCGSNGVDGGHRGDGFDGGGAGEG